MAARDSDYRLDKRLLGWLEDADEEYYAYLLLLPVFLYVGAFAIWPLVSTFWMSLHADVMTGAAVGEFIGIDRYLAIFKGEYDVFLLRPVFDTSNLLQSAIPLTIVFSVISVILTTVIGFGQALVLNTDLRGKTWLRVAIILPWTIPIIIQGMIFRMFFQPGLGSATELLQGLGLFSSAPLADSAEALVVVIIADVWKQSAFMALLILAGLQSIDRELYKVSRVSGATRWQRFRTITFPLVLPILLVAMMFRMISALWIYGPIATITECNVLPSLSCVVVAAFSEGSFGTASSVAFIQAVIVALVLVVFVVQYARASRGEGI